LRSYTKPVLGRFLSWLLGQKSFTGDGYAVRFGSLAFNFAYEEDDKKLTVDGEIVADCGERPHLAVYVNNLRWDSPHEFLVIPEEKATQIIERLKVALVQLAPGAELIR